ncbi:cobalamin biosynthesis protein CobW [Rubidibacter lacunae KORDI 51-2]|uniref:Cobalamin biosynthesis protein CobW n=1 Tax=Rubidibacter lacunae KORDI 51-2 TaxID=582515 RepID=U5DJF2_9CHRO|nr:cobalamin biosynthesis protein CobW [Rubidibacter lacunae]ERN41821.1 cobalamin biosynthesis protein CobW [Rubidibacter lacunae KORDI 51-2]
MAAKIPVTIVTGFLGAGKTTLVRHLLQHNGGRRIAVLVNEFGEVGIDGELLRACNVCDDGATGNAAVDDANNATTNIVELSNGCLCCTVQEEFLPTMQELLERRDRVDCILIETSGLALPKPLVQAFRWPEIRTGATVDGVVAAVDGEAIAAGAAVSDLAALDAQRLADPSLEHETPLEELFEDQLNCADLVLVTKSDRLDPAQLAAVKAQLQKRVRPGVKIATCAGGRIDPEILLGFNAAVEDDLDARPSHHDTEDDHDHDDDIAAAYLASDLAFEPQELVRRLRQLVREREVYRIKGFVRVPNKAMRLVVQGVGDRFETFYDRPWRSEETRQTQLVAIGRELKQSHLEAALAASIERAELPNS